MLAVAAVFSKQVLSLSPGSGPFCVELFFQYLRGFSQVLRVPPTVQRQARFSELVTLKLSKYQRCDELTMV